MAVPEAKADGWSGKVNHGPAAPKAAPRKPAAAKSIPVPPCAFKRCDFCHGGDHTHGEAEEPHPCTYPAQMAIAAHEVLSHLPMVPRLVPSCSTARVHRFFAEWSALDVDFMDDRKRANGRKIVSFLSSSLGDLPKLHQVEGYHLLPRRIFASYSAHNMLRGFAVNLETPQPSAAPEQTTRWHSWAATNCSVASETNGDLSNVGLVVRDGNVQNELVYEMRLPPCDGPVHPLLALAALDLNKVERDIGTEVTLSLSATEDGNAVITSRAHEVFIMAAGPVEDSVIEVTKERRGHAVEHVYTLREAAQKENYLMSVGNENADATFARPRITMYPIGNIDPVQRKRLVQETEQTMCAAMRFSVEFTVVFNVIPSVH